MKKNRKRKKELKKQKKFAEMGVEYKMKAEVPRLCPRQSVDLCIHFVELSCVYGP